MAGFKKDQTIAEYQQFMREIYSTPDDRFFSIYDLVSQTERFTMRALKGI